MISGEKRWFWMMERYEVGKLGDERLKLDREGRLSFLSVGLFSSWPPTDKHEFVPCDISKRSQ